ncbi:alpha/beta hydrolase family protein [Duganella qianjiadongensis]|uniref:Prolyl oligopeptidase family serine peptidase n=1 Tax=Duganella qianjiadongensis TaxID=2692176 RepID=A0ABW9VS02_9BURK|nr:alpha/beta fold hydrolase [Duganella qianjiadongensis]MYM41955.1 prolyl oligopeptidase family serine peptidase [Duganella qianjiadongensis]
MPFRYLLLLAAAAFQLMCLPAKADERPSLSDFFSQPQLSAAVFSPNGQYLAVKIGASGKRERLAVLELATEKITVVGNFTDADIGDFQWVNDQRLAFTAADREAAQGNQRYWPGLYAVNRDGTGFRQLALRAATPFITDASATRNTRDLLSNHTFLLAQAGAQNSDYLYVQERHYSGRAQVDYVSLLKVNTVTGRLAAEAIATPDHAKHWLLDYQGEPRLVQTLDKGISSILYLDPASKAWRKLAEFNAYGESKGHFSPLSFGPDGTLYVIASHGQNTSAVYTFDVNKLTLSEKPLVRLEGYDFSGHLVMNEQKLLGVRYLNDAYATEWLDDEFKAMQAKVDSMLPNTINLLTAPRRAETPWVLVNSYADIWPNRTMLYNRSTQKLMAVGEAHPTIKPEQMARTTLVHYQARDGLDIPAWLTIPQGEGKNLPMVVLVHGGPYMRGSSWHWDPEVQFLASRGYAVLQPEYRGSTGFGKKHFRAGWKQWGLKMQDDIADGTRWAIARGTADAQRVCIAGASYGGYATLMGLVNDTDLYRCGIEWAGVTDINLMRTGHWAYVSDMSESWKEYGIPQLVGDPEKDAEQLKATSPILQAARIKQPLLLAHGGSDLRVPLVHGTRFYQAVKQTNPDVEWVEYPDEGHGWSLPATRYDFWARVEKFLDKHIGKH